MARAIQVVMTCDVDESDDAEGLQTVKFGVNGADYEIDLCTEHWEEFNTSVQPYVALGRRAEDAKRSRRAPRSAAGTTAPRPASRSGGRAQLTELREWARANGYKVGDRGRISREVREAFAAAH